MSYYFFSKFRDRNFPIYSATQKGCGNLVRSHFHNAIEFISIEHGIAEVYVGTAKFKATQGDVVYIPPLCIHSLNGLSADCQISGLVFESEIIPKEIISAKEIYVKGTANNLLISASNPSGNALRASVQNAIQEYHNPEGSSNLLLLAELLKITDSIIRFQSVNQPNDDFKRLEPVVTYIRNNYHQKITISDLSAILHICDGHMIRLFQQNLHTTPINYIIDCRLEQAMKLLITTDMSVSDIATTVGFSTTSYMIKLFQERLSTSPLKFRNSKEQIKA